MLWLMPASNIDKCYTTRSDSFLTTLCSCTDTWIQRTHTDTALVLHVVHIFAFLFFIAKWEEMDHKVFPDQFFDYFPKDKRGMWPQAKISHTWDPSPLPFHNWLANASLTCIQTEGQKSKYTFSICDEYQLYVFYTVISLHYIIALHQLFCSSLLADYFFARITAKDGQLLFHE